MSRRRQPGDDAAGAGLLGVARAGHHHAHGGVAREGRGPHSAQRAGGHRHEQLGGVARQQREHHLGLGIAEADVVLNHLGPLVTQHQAGVEHAAVVDAPPVQGGEQRLHRGGHDVVHLGRPDVGHRGVGAHAAGVRTAVAVADALEVLGRQQGHRGRAVVEDEEGALLAGQSLLNDDAPPGLAEGGPGELGLHVRPGFCDGLRHQHALAGGQPVGLDHPGPGQALEVGQRLGALGGVEGGVAGRGHAGVGQDLLHEGLRALQAGPVGTGSHDGAPVGPQAVGQPVDQRGLGPDHHQVGLDLFGRRRRHRDRVRHARVARRDHHLGRAGQHVGQRVLPAPTADDADLHATAPVTRGRPSRGGKRDELLAARAHADQADRDADLLGQKAHVVAGGLGHVRR